MRFSNSYIPTKKEAPSDAVLASHIFLDRAGFIQQVSAGVYNFLPLGKRVLDKIKAIVKEELDAINAQEVQLGFVTPVSLWEESGRLEKFGKELLRFKDRKENTYILGPTHEEMMVNMIRGQLKSYKQLPLNVYQINHKFRDEARPRFGLMRGREFLMKDAYSFHSNEEDLIREFNLMEKTYKKILDRLGLDYRVVEANSGAIGGNGSKELMVLADSGEDTLIVCSSCEYGANVEAAKREIKTTDLKEPKAEFNKFFTPNIKSIDDLSLFFKMDKHFIVKAVAKIAVFDNEEKIVIYFIRGNDELQEVKAANAIGANEVIDISEDDLKEYGLVVGFIGPLDLDKVEVILDNELKNNANMLCGANEIDKHFIGVDLSVLKNSTFKDIITVKADDQCPHCQHKLKETKGIEVGHIFQLGTTYSKPLKASFLDKDGKEKALLMGTYGLGISRLVASIVEQHHDERGCKWTKSTAPLMVNILVSNIKNEIQMNKGEEIYKALKEKNIDVIIDDRKERFGFKMKDTELIGFPLTIIIGKSLDDGNIEVYDRKTNKKTTVEKSNIILYIMDLI